MLSIFPVSFMNNTKIVESLLWMKSDEESEEILQAMVRVAAKLEEHQDAKVLPVIKPERRVTC